ncbi:hypothetical protein M2167_001073 [Streptomyces sp. SPB4]|nr:hypothetical protein [Streptomyces sp. SPB4]
MTHGNLAVLASGAHAYTAACAMLIYGVPRFPSPRPEP